MDDYHRIGISKDKLDALWSFHREQPTVCNNQKGCESPFLFWTRVRIGITRVIFESTGVYHRLSKRLCAKHGISYCAGQSASARRFCEVQGQTWPKRQTG